MKRNIKWIHKWDINISECPNNKGEIKRYVQEKFNRRMWKGRKNEYAIEHYNPT